MMSSFKVRYVNLSGKPLTPREHLALPIEQRISRYEDEFLWGSPDGPLCRSGAGGGGGSRSYYENELHEYVLYRLKREEFEIRELEKEAK